MRITHASLPVQPKISNVVSRTSVTRRREVHNFAIEFGDCRVLLIYDNLMII